jgi:phosphohistidine phosphatase SixA
MRRFMASTVAAALVVASPVLSAGKQEPYAKGGSATGQKGHTDQKGRPGLKGQALLGELKKGGYVIYFRHFETGQDYADQVTADVDNCWTQRRLNTQGFRDAQRIGKLIHDQNIVVSRVLASPFCRTWQSADLAFGRHERIAALQILKAKDYKPEQNAVMKAGLMPFVTTAPAAGTNVVVIAHDDNLTAAGGPLLGIQGEAAIIKPDGKGSFELIARLKHCRNRACESARSVSAACPGQLLAGEMAGGLVAVGGRDECWFLAAAAVDGVRATGVEAATGRRLDRAWHIAFQDDALAVGVWIDDRHR